MGLYDPPSLTYLPLRIMEHDLADIMHLVYRCELVLTPSELRNEGTFPMVAYFWQRKFAIRI
jgi:hypothetical protein